MISAEGKARLGRFTHTQWCRRRPRRARAAQERLRTGAAPPPGSSLGSSTTCVACLHAFEILPVVTVLQTRHGLGPWCLFPRLLHRPVDWHVKGIFERLWQGRLCDNIHQACNVLHMDLRGRCRFLSKDKEGLSVQARLQRVEQAQEAAAQLRAHLGAAARVQEHLRRQPPSGIRVQVLQIPSVLTCCNGVLTGYSCSRAGQGAQSKHYGLTCAGMYA